jgi:hypothetical protein
MNRLSYVRNPPVEAGTLIIRLRLHQGQFATKSSPSLPTVHLAATRPCLDHVVSSVQRQIFSSSILPSPTGVTVVTH